MAGYIPENNANDAHYQITDWRNQTMTDVILAKALIIKLLLLWKNSGWIVPDAEIDKSRKVRAWNQTFDRRWNTGANGFLFACLEDMPVDGLPSSMEWIGSLISTWNVAFDGTESFEFMSSSLRLIGWPYKIHVIQTGVIHQSTLFAIIQHFGPCLNTSFKLAMRTNIQKVKNSNQ